MPAAAGLQNGLLFVAFLLIVCGFLMRRAARRRIGRTEPANVGGRADAIVRQIESREVRLYEYSRAIEASFETRMAALRQRIAEADATAARLETLLNELRDRDDLALLPFDEQSRAARMLKQAGYSDEQVARLLDRGEEAGDSLGRAA